MSNEKKTEQLGMSFSKASGRLKKMYLLSLLQRIGEDNCYRCGEKITTIDNMSIEHKQPWLDISTDLFWDLENIAHSHFGCNASAGRRGPRKVTPAMAAATRRAHLAAKESPKFKEAARRNLEKARAIKAAKRTTS